MGIVRADQGYSGFFCYIHKSAVYGSLFGNPVFLKLQVELIFSKQVSIGQSLIHSFFLLAGQYQRGNFPCQTCGKAYKASGMSGEQFVVDSRFIVKTLRICCRTERYQVLISRLVLSEENQVVVVIPGFGTRFQEPRARSHVKLASYEGVDARISAFFVKTERSEHVTVVRYGHMVHVEAFRLRYQALYGSCPVEK